MGNNSRRFDCKRCGKGWKTILEHPVSCRWCGSKLWDKDRVRKAGAGRPKGAVESAVPDMIGELRKRIPLKMAEKREDLDADFEF